MIEISRAPETREAGTVPDGRYNPEVAAREILLVTRTITRNQGNQALSIVWRDLLSDCFPDHLVRPIERSPAYLKRFRVGRFAAAENPLAAFDAVAWELLAGVPRRPMRRPPIDPAIRYDARIRRVHRFRAFRRMLSIRSRLAGLGLSKRTYFERLALFPGAAMVVVNPAGEFMAGATDAAIGYLLDIRCAQLLGIPTAVVNLSFEVTDSTVRRLSAFVFDQCDLVEFRDCESQKQYAATGGLSIPLVLPDAALLTNRPTKPSHITKGSVAIAINGLQVRDAGLEGEWAKFLQRLVESGLTPTLTSNEWSTDAPMWGPLLAKKQISTIGQGKDYRDYMEMLGGFEIVVSSRLHSCVLAMLAGTVVIPLEVGTFKLTGFFQQAGFTEMPVRLGTPGWQDEILRRLAAIHADPASARASQAARRDAARCYLQDSLTGAFCGLNLAALPASA